MKAEDRLEALLEVLIAAHGAATVVHTVAALVEETDPDVAANLRALITEHHLDENVG